METILSTDVLRFSLVFGLTALCGAARLLQEAEFGGWRNFLGGMLYSGLMGLATALIGVVMWTRLSHSFEVSLGVGILAGLANVEARKVLSHFAKRLNINIEEKDKPTDEGS